ncbi:MAG: polysaccharide pyruvyl transferase family protein [Actinobacteria bacterium]|nr:polysaccharide pyruvyl transferase family protein [Actinomycetota bacterium]
MNIKNRILLFGNYDGTNIGDDCILLHVLDKFAKHTNEICVPSRRPAYIAEKYHVNSIPLLSFQFVSEFLRSNVILIGGGGIFSRYVGSYAKFLPLFAILAKLFGKKVIYYKIGIYRTTPFLIKELVKLSMLCSDEISVRDKSSVDAIGFVSKAKTVKITPDPGLTLKPINKNLAKRLLQNEGVVGGKFLVGLSLKYTMDKEINSKIVSEFSRFIDWVIKEFDVEIVFFPFSFNQRRIVENDVHIAKKIRTTMSENKVNFKIIRTWNYTPHEIKGLVGLMNVYIGMRFHSIIFAYSMGTPLIGVSYEEKCKDFLKSRQLPFIEVKDVGFDVMKQFFLSHYKGRKK